MKSNKKIYLVEDDKEIIEFIKEAVKLESDLVVISFETGLSALKQIKINKPDLVILDLGLKDVEGEYVCKQIRSMYKYLPIIILTGYKDKKRMVESFNLGADDYITKPFDIDILIARVRAKLRNKTNMSDSAELHAEDLVMNTEKYEVSRDNKTISLTAKEFELLRFLMLNKNILLSRDKILNAVWGYNNEIETRVVDVHIGKLRKKIDSKAKNKLIISLRGFGYKLISKN